MGLSKKKKKPKKQQQKNNKQNNNDFNNQKNLQRRFLLTVSKQILIELIIRLKSLLNVSLENIVFFEETSPFPAKGL